MYTLYAIPNCDTVKKARAWLADHQVEYQFHDYRKQGIDRPTIDRWLTQRRWDELVNRAGLTWKRLPEADRPTNAEAATVLMMANPSVIRRPLIEAASKMVTLGFNASEYDAIFAGAATV